MAHIQIGPMLQVVFHRGACLDHSSLLYINDLHEVVQSYIAIFADDTKLYRPIITPDDSNVLQSDLDLLDEWCKVWLINFNYTKCKHLSFGHNSPSRQYTMGSSVRSVQLMKKMT